MYKKYIIIAILTFLIIIFIYLNAKNSIESISSFSGIKLFKSYDDYDNQLNYYTVDYMTYPMNVVFKPITLYDLEQQNKNTNLN